MAGFIYKRVSPETANSIMEWADKEGVLWDIWNPEEWLLGGDEVEIGLLDWSPWEAQTK